MLEINKQINELRLMFDTKRIIDSTSRAKLTKEELAEIKRVINNKNIDGDYEVYDSIVVQLKNGFCYIKDNSDV
jgi:hypothetical protein